MLSRDEVTRIEVEASREKRKWLSLACVDEGTLTALILTAAAVLRKPDSKERKERLAALIKQIHDKGIYTVDTVMRELKELE